MVLTDTLRTILLSAAGGSVGAYVVGRLLDFSHRALLEEARANNRNAQERLEAATATYRDIGDTLRVGRVALTRAGARIRELEAEVAHLRGERALAAAPLGL
jgi:hypothetical protein